MQNKKLIYGLSGALLAIALILGIVICHLKKDDELNIVFLDVGQGDAILIESGHNQVIIDGGKNEDALLERLGEFMPFWDRTVEAIVITHPDSDHFGGLLGVLKNYRVKNIIRTDAESHSMVWKALQEIVAEKKPNKIMAMNGVKIKFPNQAIIETLFPLQKISQYPKNANDASVVMRLIFGKNSFLFTGDLPMDGENEILAKGINVKSKVLKVGHHGSRFSTGEKFLEAVNPEDAVISVGKKNRYGHPTQEVLNKLNRRLIRIWRTDQDGNIIYKCENINKKCQVFAEQKY